MASSMRRRGGGEPTSRSTLTSTAPSGDTRAGPAPRAKLHFRPRSRSRIRLLTGVALIAAAVAINLAVYRRLDERVPVLQLTHDVPAGARLVDGDLREVEASISSDINIVSNRELVNVVGQTAKVRLVAGSLLVHEVIQTAPLVAPGASVVALTFPTGELPTGLRERSHVLLVLVTGTGATMTSSNVDARVSTLPVPASGQSDRQTLSFEVAAADAPAVVVAERVRVVLLDPGSDPAYSVPPTGGGG